MDQLANVLQQLATQLGVTAEYLWPVLVRYTWAAGMSALALNTGVLFVALLVPSLTISVLKGNYESRKQLRHEWDTRDLASYRAGERAPDRPDLNAYGLAVGVICILCVLLAFATLINIADALPAVIAPEGRTVMEILKVVGKK